MSHITPPPNPKQSEARAAMLAYKVQPEPIELTPAQLLTLQTLYPTLLDSAVIERGGFVISDDEHIAVYDERVITLTWKGRGQ